MDDTVWNHLTAAKSKRPDLQPEPRVQAPMRAGLKPADRKAPSADQKRVRRQQARTAAGHPMVYDEVYDSQGAQAAEAAMNAGLLSPTKGCDHCCTSWVGSGDDTTEVCDHCGGNLALDEVNPTEGRIAQRVSSPEGQGRYDGFHDGFQGHPKNPHSQDPGYLKGYEVGYEHATDPLHEDSYDPQLPAAERSGTPSAPSHWPSFLGPRPHTSAQSSANKESTMSTQHTEADLLAKMAAATTLTEQSYWGEMLTQHRQARREQISTDGGLDWGGMSHLDVAPTFAFEPLTASMGQRQSEHLDWGSLVSEDVDIKTLAINTQAQATMWVQSVWAPVRDDPEEFRSQAMAAAHVASLQYGAQYEQARSIFLAKVADLEKIADFGPAEPDKVQQIGDSVIPNEALPPNPTDSTFDGLVNGETGSSQDPKSTSAQTPSLQEGSQPEGDHSESIEPPVNDTDGAKYVNDNAQGTTYTDPIPSGGTTANHTAGDNHAPCPNHKGQSYNKSTGDCSCGSNHNRWASPMNPGGYKSASLFDRLRSAFAETDPKSTEVTQAAPSVQEGDTPEGDHAEPAVNGNESAQDASTWGRDPDVLPTGGQDGTNAATSGQMPGTPTTSARLGSADLSDDELEALVSKQHVLSDAWNKAFSDLKSAGVEHDADHPAAKAYRDASDAVNHVNRKLDYYVSTGRVTSKPGEPMSVKRSASKTADVVNDVMRYESGEMDEDEMIAFFQRLIDDGIVWQLQGSYGRTAQSLIDAGLCHPAHTASKTGSSDPAWLTERNNDPYGTPNKRYNKDTGEYYDNPFWVENKAEMINGYKVFEKDGRWFAYHPTKNYWMKLSATDAAGARAEVEGMNSSLDMWASLGSRIESEAQTDNTRTFGRALASLASLDDKVGEFTGHQIVAFVLASSDVSPDVRGVLANTGEGMPPFSREAAEGGWAILTPEGKPLWGKIHDTEKEARDHFEQVKGMGHTHLAPDDIATYTVGRVSKTAGSAWSRRHYEDIAEALGSLPDGEREKAAKHFSHHLNGTNPYYNRAFFEEAASKAGYSKRPAVRAEAKYTRGQRQLLKDALDAYDGDKEKVRGALGHRVASLITEAGEGLRMPMQCPSCGHKWTKKAMYGGEHCPKCKTKGEVKWKTSGSKTAGDGTSVEVASLPDCDIHNYELGQPGVKAAYDGKTKMGPWANMCEDCFKIHGVGLGTGKGQRLILKGSAGKTAGRHDRCDYSSRKQAGPLDRSVMWTLLLEYFPGFGQMTHDQTDPITSDYLAAWGQSGETDMAKFVKDRIAGQ